MPDVNRVYHYHVRKSAGSSLNAAFWALGGLDFHTAEVTLRASPNSEVVANGLRFLRDNPTQIAAGDFFFATTHRPAYYVEVPSDTFTITILRDPVRRVLSYYRYVMWARTSEDADSDPFVDQVRYESRFLDPYHTLKRLSPRRLKTEGAIRELGAAQFLTRQLPVGLRSERTIRDSEFRRFLARIPPRALLSQLHMFSARLDPIEAAERILSCSCVCFTETFSTDLAKLAAQLNLALVEKRERRIEYELSLDEHDIDFLRERLALEYEMMAAVRRGLQCGG